ncbi:hypothetical protein AHAS_Ahas16G0089900 [Arachis hypogaea]
MNKIRDQVIWASEAIRLPKPSAVLSNPYCKFSYADLESNRIYYDSLVVINNILFNLFKKANNASFNVFM